MSADRISAGKRKASDVGLDSENLRFSPKLKPIVTSRPRRPACNQRLLEFKANTTSDVKGAVDFVSPTEQVDFGTVGSILSTENVDVGVNSNNLTDGDEGCETPKSEEHRITKNLTCPPAPRKPRLTVRRKTESATTLSEALFVSPSNLNLLFELRPATKNFKVRGRSDVCRSEF